MAKQSPQASVAAGLVALRALNAPSIRCISLSPEPGGLSGVGVKAALEAGAGPVVRLARVVLDGDVGEAAGGLLPLAWVGLFSSDKTGFGPTNSELAGAMDLDMENRVYGS